MRSTLLSLIFLLSGILGTPERLRADSLAADDSGPIIHLAVRSFLTQRLAIVSFATGFKFP